MGVAGATLAAALVAAIVHGPLQLVEKLLLPLSGFKGHRSTCWRVRWLRLGLVSRYLLLSTLWQLRTWCDAHSETAKEARFRAEPHLWRNLPLVLPVVLPDSRGASHRD